APRPPGGGVPLPRAAPPRYPARGESRARRLRVLEASRRGCRVLHRGRRSLQLPGRLVHPRPRTAAGAREGARERGGGVVATNITLRNIGKDGAPAPPGRPEPLRVAVYAPLAQAPVPPDVVLVRGRARQIMLVVEAALAAG